MNLKVNQLKKQKVKNIMKVKKVKLVKKAKLVKKVKRKIKKV